MLALDLSQSFTTSDAPWKTLQGTASAPAVAFHTLSAFANGTNLLAFGGTSVTDPSGSDSAYTVQLSFGANQAAWLQSAASADQPPRRVYHSADCDGTGNVWIVGGERADDTSTLYDEAWTINAADNTPQFEQISPPPSAVAGATTLHLSDGRLAVMGGIGSQNSLQSFESIMTYDTSSKKWSSTATSAAGSAGFPPPRRNHVAVALPDKRIFVHGGGGDAALTTALSDAWVLDWSKSPPSWSTVSMDSGTAPSARFAHSAVAYGNKVAMAFGWAAYNAADTNVYILDMTDLVINANGTASGSQWVTSYTPDPSAGGSSTGNGAKQSGSSSDGTSSGTDTSGSSSGTSSGTGGSSSDGDGGGQSGGSSGNGGNGDGFSGSGSNGNGDGDGSGGGTGSSTGTKAGAVLGSLLGLGALVGVAYYGYRRHQGASNNWRHGEGAGALLRGSNHYSGADDLMMEKDLEGGAAAYRPGMHPSGPRTLNQQEYTPASWSMANMGHAVEGSGPHLRERLALLTGLGRNAGQAQPHRFNMLADEDEDMMADSIAIKHATQPQSHHLGDYNAADDDYFNESGHTYGAGRRLREHSYGHIGQYDADDYVMGDLGAPTHHGHGMDEQEMFSPFHDDESRAGVGAGLAAAGGAAILLSNQRNKVPVDDQYDDRLQEETNSSQSHGDSSSKSRGGQVSFSDAPEYSTRRRASGPRVSGPRAGPSPLIRRSPTWWDRFMNQSFLERTASGRFYAGPRSEEPIRDPAEPPQLTAIKEASHTSDPSATVDPFFSGNGYDNSHAAIVDEQGRTHYGAAAQHGKSMSSLQSGRTATSSILEARMRTMDVVQRAGTASTRRTASTDRSSMRTASLSSTGALSRHVSLRDAPANTSRHQARTQASTSEATPYGVWEPHRRGLGQTSEAVDEQGEEEISAANDESRDIVDFTSSAIAPAALSRHGRVVEPADSRSAASSMFLPQLRHIREAEDDPHHGAPEPQHATLGQLPKVREPSEAPSMTPSTTKRARQNPDLISPVSPLHQPVREPPVQGSVQDRVRAIERKWTDEGDAAVLPVPRSPATSMLSATSSGGEGGSGGSANGGSNTENDYRHVPAPVYVPGRGGRPIPTRLDVKSSAKPHRGASPGAQAISGSPNDVTMPQVTSPDQMTHHPDSAVAVNGQDEAARDSNVRYSHGLVPKAQLFVANPDNRHGSSSSG